METKIAEIDRKINAVFNSVERTRKYFLWTLIITVGAVLLPLVGLAFAIPFYLKTLDLGGFGI